MKYVKFKNLFEILMLEKDNRDVFIKSVPVSIQDAFFDNEYVESYYREVNALMVALFHQPLIDDIDYFLYDTKPWKIIQGVNGERSYEINTIEEMLLYFEAEYAWDDC